MFETYGVSDLERFLEECGTQVQRSPIIPSTKRWTIDKQSFLTEATGTNKRYDETCDSRNVSSPRCPSSPEQSPREDFLEQEPESKREKIVRSLPLFFEHNKLANLPFSITKSASLGVLEEKKKETIIQTSESDGCRPRPRSESLSEKLSALERYEVLKTLLIHEKGEIYLVKEKLTDSLYVLKLIPKKNSEKSPLNLLAMAKREAQVLQKLNLDLEDADLSHSDKNLLPLQATWEYEQYNMVMLNWENGIQLRDVVRVYGRLSEREAQILTIKLLDTLLFLHKNQIILGDLNPDVVLISANRDVRIMDFGASTEITRSPAEGMVGTPGWMSPEMTEAKTYGPESDMFSLGLLLYFALTGKTLLSNSTNEQEAVNQEYIQNMINEDMKSNCFSIQCRYFLEKLLQLNPLRRMTAEEAFSQPWISLEDIHTSSGPAFFAL